MRSRTILAAGSPWVVRLGLFVLIAAGAAALCPARAAVSAVIDLSEQTMRVYVDGTHVDTWKVSTARRGYRTPIGTFRPTLLARYHYSSKYDNAPMPHSVFFLGGYAIHGTTEIRSLGRPVSHGCVRLHPANAARLFELIMTHGLDNTRIQISR